MLPIRGKTNIHRRLYMKRQNANKKFLTNQIQLWEAMPGKR